MKSNNINANSMKNKPKKRNETTGENECSKGRILIKWAIGEMQRTLTTQMQMHTEWFKSMQNIPIKCNGLQIGWIGCSEQYNVKLSLNVKAPNFQVSCLSIYQMLRRRRRRRHQRRSQKRRRLERGWVGRTTRLPRRRASQRQSRRGMKRGGLFIQSFTIFTILSLWP